MPKFFAQWGGDFVVNSVTESTEIIEGANVAECDGYHVIGKKREGDIFVDVSKPLRYKIFEKPRFIVALGEAVYFQIKAAEGTSFEFYRYTLDNSPHVDMNIPEFRAMVEALHTAGLIDAEKLAFFLVQE
jgi:hypothetical protein